CPRCRSSIASASVGPRRACSVGARSLPRPPADPRGPAAGSRMMGRLTTLEVLAMSRRPIALSVLAASVALAGVVAPAALQAQTQAQTQTQTQTQTRTQAQEQIYGSQLMTRRERTEYRSRMRTAKTAE